ncbi:MAG: hypothetical protein PHZ23_15090 [Acidiphilium sp.]|nr:hypothetical protein [Acidiphilium sp.]
MTAASTATDEFAPDCGVMMGLRRDDLALWTYRAIDGSYFTQEMDLFDQQSCVCLDKTQQMVKRRWDNLLFDGWISDKMPETLQKFDKYEYGDLFDDARKIINIPFYSDNIHAPSTSGFPYVVGDLMMMLVFMARRIVPQKQDQSLIQYRVANLERWCNVALGWKRFRDAGSLAGGPAANDLTRKLDAMVRGCLPRDDGVSHTTWLF